MKRGNHGIAILVGLAGAGVCTVAVVHFIRTILNNRLSWSPHDTARDLYLAVGHSYTQGFTVGFFLCFSLAVAAIAISGWLEARREGFRLPEQRPERFRHDSPEAHVGAASRE